MRKGLQSLQRLQHPQQQHMQAHPPILQQELDVPNKTSIFQNEQLSIQYFYGQKQAVYTMIGWSQNNPGTRINSLV